MHWDIPFQEYHRSHMQASGTQSFSCVSACVLDTYGVRWKRRKSLSFSVCLSHCSLCQDAVVVSCNWSSGVFHMKSVLKLPLSFHINIATNLGQNVWECYLLHKLPFFMTSIIIFYYHYCFFVTFDQYNILYPRVHISLK